MNVIPTSILFLIQMYGIEKREKKNLKHGSKITAKFYFSPNEHAWLLKLEEKIFEEIINYNHQCQ